MNRKEKDYFSKEDQTTTSAQTKLANALAWWSQSSMFSACVLELEQPGSG
jgi:hypothetical protein